MWPLCWLFGLSVRADDTEFVQLGSRIFWYNDVWRKLRTCIETNLLLANGNWMKRSIAKGIPGQAERTRRTLSLTAEESASQSVCQMCGLCCNGTLFSYVPLTAADDFASSKLADCVVTADGQSVLKQACSYYRKRSCLIYQDGRPHNCVIYQCKLLKRYVSGAISQQHALQEIRKTVRRVNFIKWQMRAQAGAPAKNLTELFQTWIASQGGCYSKWPLEHDVVWQEYQDLLFHLKQTFGLGESSETTQATLRLPSV